MTPENLIEPLPSSGPAPITVLLADDHPAVRMGVRMRLEREPDIEVVGEAGDGGRALEMIGELRPDVAVVDLRMPSLDGIEVAGRVAAQVIGTRVLLLTAVSEAHLVQRALDAGAAGYIDKESPLEVVVTAVRSVAGGGRYIDPALVAALLESTDDRLSERELQVLQLAANGHQNRGIAQELALSEETVKSHISNVIRKLNANSRTEAVASALRRSLIQ